MYKTFFGLTHAPLGKECTILWDNGQLTKFNQQFNWLLQSPGLGLLTAEPGAGKTALLRQATQNLNPHQFAVYYIADTDFGRLDFYRELAVVLGLQPAYRRAQLWRDIKTHITHLATQKNILPIMVIDESQNLTQDFFRDFPAFLNFVFDSREYMTVWLLGHPELAREMDRPHNKALASRMQARFKLLPINDRDSFKQLVTHGFIQAGCTQNLISDSGFELMRMASKGNPRLAHQIVVTSLRIACDKKIAHLPDDIIDEAIAILKQS